jgi:hypothetical protein
VTADCQPPISAVNKNRKISRASSFVQLIRRSTADLAHSAGKHGGRRGPLKRQSTSSDTAEQEMILAAMTLEQGPSAIVVPKPRRSDSVREKIVRKFSAHVKVTRRRSNNESRSRVWSRTENGFSCLEPSHFLGFERKTFLGLERKSVLCLFFIVLPQLVRFCPCFAC